MPYRKTPMTDCERLVTEYGLEDVIWFTFDCTERRGDWPSDLNDVRQHSSDTFELVVQALRDFPFETCGELIRAYRLLKDDKTGYEYFVASVESGRFRTPVMWAYSDNLKPVATRVRARAHHRLILEHWSMKRELWRLKGKIFLGFLSAALVALFVYLAPSAESVLMGALVYLLFGLELKHSLQKSKRKFFEQQNKVRSSLAKLSGAVLVRPKEFDASA